MKKTTFLLIYVLMFSVVIFCFAGEGDPKNGKKLFSDPKLADSTNDTACINCHQEEDAFKSLSKDKDLNKIINICITNTLEGKPLGNDSQEMKDLKSFILSQSK